MMTTITTLSPRQTFEDNMRPAVLLLRVYRLLDSKDNIRTEGELLDALREIVQASTDEDLMLIYNELFLGLVRERAQLPRSTLRQATLCHLLRQAVVASCTALETYLPALLRANLPVMIRARGRDFVPRGDQTVQQYFADLQFSLDETLRLLGDENAPEYISNKILGLANFKYLSSRKGIHVVGVLLGLSEPKPWDAIAAHLNRDKRELMNTLDDTVRRRNDIVHRADRPQTDPGGEAQEIAFAWTQQAVDTIKHICLALDELVAARVAELEAMISV
jgi:AcrR family transcriptional regulator